MSDSAQEILEDLASVRASIRERVTGMTGMTEREVLAAGNSLNGVVAAARSHVELIRGVLEATTDGGQGSAGAGAGAGAVLAQSEAMRAFLSEMLGHLGLQKRAAAAAHSRSTEIGSTTKAVAALARAAHILTLNAKIETARSSGTGGGVFSAISDEMQKLSKEVQSTNAQISALASTLSDSLPQVAELANRMEALTTRFSQQLTESIERVHEEERRARAHITEALEAGDEVLAKVLAGAGESLSHLQFQDSTAQGLMEIDHWLFDLKERVATFLGIAESERAQSRVEPLHVTIGGPGSDFDRADAGELTLF